MGFLSYTGRGYRSDARSGVRHNKKRSGFEMLLVSYVLALRVCWKSEIKRLEGNAVFRLPLFANVSICILVMDSVP